MALGHALLHPERLRRVLDADASADTMGATVDAGLGIFGFGDPGPAAAAWAEGLRQRTAPVVEALGRAGREGPFAAFFQAPAPDIPGLMEQLGGLLDATTSLDADGIRRRLMTAVDLLLDALPELRLPAVATGLQAEIDAALGILEAPLAGGRRDPAAHRAFRTAAEIRRRLRRLGEPLPPRLQGIELKAMLRAQISAQLATIDAAALTALAAQIGGLKTEFGALFDALGRVSVTVKVEAGGPQPMSDAPADVLNLGKVTPFARGHAMWWLDLLTGVVAVFNLIWEMVRTSNFTGRAFDGTVSVLVLLWQMARVATRAAIPDDMVQWPTGSQWLFSDQGDFVLSIGARFIAAFNDAGALTNWVGSVLVRGMKHVTAVSQPRFIYQFARSLHYFTEWRKLPEARRPPPDFLRTTWMAWGPMWSLAWIFSLFPAWDDFRLEGLATSVWVSLLVGGLLALGTCIGMLAGVVSGAKPAEDHASRGVMLGLLVLIVVLVAVLLEGLESDDAGLAIGLLIGVSVTMLAVIILGWLPQLGAGWSFLLITVTGIFGAFAVPFILGYDYIDDGRDKPGRFKGLNADTSPYRLPYTSGENWMCSQGTHGIFSHHTLNGTSNHYAFDFNAPEGSVVRAAREGIVTELEESFENRKQDANFLHVLHTSWVQGHDPGTDDERVLTYANYYHLMQGGVLPMLGQTVRRGEDIARLDSTGRSAQQHIHIAAQEQQRGEEQGLPYVFGDADTKGFRNYPLLAILPGKGKIAGKPLAYAFYTSANAAPSGAAAPAALEFALDAGGPGDHLHRVIIPAEVVGGAGDPVEVFAEPQLGHSHRITLTRAAIARMRSPNSLAAAEVTIAAAPDGHLHALLTAPLRRLRLETVNAADATAGEHRHLVWPDPTILLAGIPATVTFASSNDFNDAGTPAPHHTHPVVFTAAAIRALLRRERPAAGDVTIQVSNGHSHRLGEALPQPTDGALPGLAAAIVAPPNARLAATQPGPYRLFGGQAVLRVNDRLTEAWLHGAHRPRLLPEVPAERGLAPAESLVFGATTIATATDTRGSARLAAAAITQALRASGGTRRYIALAAAPVIIIETRTRGSAARLRRIAGGAAIFGSGAGAESHGAGDLPNIAAIPRAVLAAHIEQFLRHGWPAPPVGMANAFQPGGPPLDLSPSAPRNAAVLALAAAPADGAIASPQPLPLQPGPVGVTAGWGFPLLAGPAVLPLDLTHPAMSAAQREATPLIVTVAGTDQPVRFTTADTDAAAVARRIMLEADGVRATVVNAGTVQIATLAGGAAISLELRKDSGFAFAGPTGATGSSAPLAAGTMVRDSGAVGWGLLRDAALDAAARATLPYDPAVVQPAVTVEGDHIRLAVAAGQTIRPLSAPLPLLPGSGPAAAQWDSDPLPAVLSLAGSAWMDIELAGTTVRVPLTGEPARLELGPLPRLPTPGERLLLEVDGASVDVTFNGAESSVAGVSARIALALADRVTVRLAWQVTAGGTLHGGRTGPAVLSLAESPGLNLLGFLRPRAGLSDSAAGSVGDALAAGPGAPLDAAAPALALQRRGARSTRFSVPAGDPPSLAASPGDTLVLAAPTIDPLGLTIGPAHVATMAAALPVALPGQTTSWQVTANSGGVAQAIGIAQLTAMPAALRAQQGPEAAAGATLSLSVRVTGPDGVRPEVAVDLSGIASAEEAAARLAMAPGVTAFPVTLPIGPVVQLETLGRGTGWSLRLSGRDALLALGFRPPAYDLASNVLEIAGGGTVADGAAVTAAEIRAMLQRLAEGAVAPEQNPPPLYAVTATPAAVLLAPGVPGGPGPALAADPPSYAASLGASLAGGNLSIPTGTTRPLSALLRVEAGPRRTTLPLLGSPAELRSPDPMPGEGTPEALEQLAYVQAGSLRIRVDGTLVAVPAPPTPLASLDEAVEWIGTAIAPGWAGLVADPPGGTARHLVLRSARRGSSAAIEVLLTAPPASGLFGFATSDSAIGSGTLADAEVLGIAGSAGSLQDLLIGRAGRADSPQTLFRASGDDAAGTLRLLPNGSATLLGNPIGLPPGVTIAPDTGTILLTTGPAQVMDSRLLTIPVTPPGGDPATITAALWGAPARLPPLALPTALAVLAGKTLDVVVDGVAVSITLAAPASGNALAAQIARACGWRLRGFIRGTDLVLETLRQGSAASLTLNGGTALTDAPATGFSAPPRPLSASGAGSLPDLAAATPSAIGAALQAGWLEAGTAVDVALLGTQMIDRSTYAPGAVAGNGWVLNSQRRGIAGRLEFLAVTPSAPGEPVWDTSLGRGAAVRAAVALPAIAAPVAPNGTLALRLDDNSGPDLPSAHEVVVSFDGSALDAAGVAARIDAALRAANAGAAAAWPDGRVVIETAVPGLGGSLEVPARGTRGVADLLVGGAGAMLQARGWPGGGLAAATRPMAQGWRAVRTAAAAAAIYEFRADGGRSTGPLAITAGTDAATAAQLLNTAFGATSSGEALRIGVAGVVEGALCVEAGLLPLTLVVNGVVLAAAAASQPGETPEAPADAAFDLRRTDRIRTLRLIRAGTDAPEFTDALDFGWLRHPMLRQDPATPAGIAAAANALLEPASLPAMPVGRWLAAARPDAARAANAVDAMALSQATAMAALAAPQAGPGSPAAPLILRYWVTVTRDNALLGGSAAGPEPFMLDLLTWR